MLACGSVGRRQSVHRLELFILLLHVLAGLALQGILYLAESIAELYLVCAHKLSHFLPIEHEVELGNGLNLEGLTRLSVLVSVHSAKDDVLVSIGATCTLKSGLKAHARPAPLRPKVYNNALVVPNDRLQLHKRGYLAHFAELRGRGALLPSHLLRRLVLLLLLLLLGLLLLVLLDELALLGGQHLQHGWVVHHLLDLGREGRQLRPFSLLFLPCLSHPERQGLLIVEELVGSEGETLLHVDHHGRDLLAEVRLEEFARDLRILPRDAIACHQGCHFVSEGVRVVVEDVIGALCVLLGNVFEQLHEDVFGHLGLSQAHYLGWLSYKSHFLVKNGEIIRVEENIPNGVLPGRS